ncbi:MAG: putative DNA binding domain-containing protein [Candidatus Methanoplasma sp.]|jgi:ATP-dependent DNA helicase RecG|nr:putative DNA binding domain-containing protein [Candidatus Methanoplasma sp.]
MDADRFRSVLSIGETATVEFERAGSGVRDDVYETVCSFLNRFGGDIYLGVEDDGEVRGVPGNAIPGMIKNIISTVSNPEVFSPAAFVSPEEFEYEGKRVVRIRVNPSPEVHSFKKSIYDRASDSDVRLKSTGDIARMYLRKQNVYTERRIFAHARDDDLRLDLLPMLRRLALDRDPGHPWKGLSDEGLLKSAGLIGRDVSSGEEGYNLAAILLLGRDDVIKSVAPAYRTDAILRKANADRYDDRLIVETNLIESYSMLAGFAEKHLLDKFYLENDVRVSLRGKIAREMISNTLIHREFTSPYIAKFVIERDRMYTENANRAMGSGPITPDSLSPVSKNPIIASFFRNAGLADELGSGARNLFRYVRLYSGSDPEMIEGDVFRTTVPLDDEYSFDALIGRGGSRTRTVPSEKASEKASEKRQGGGRLNDTQKSILNAFSIDGRSTIDSVSREAGVTRRTVERNIRALREGGLIYRGGGDRGGVWIVRK